MRTLQRSLIAVLLAAPAGALAAPAGAPIVDHYDAKPWGEPVASVDVFYDTLAPYGIWVEDRTYGRVFIPDLPQFVPYRDGHWQYSTVGFAWISSEPFAWATTHYGRWAYLPTYDRWAWRPDLVWGPAWVEWRQSEDYFGWAPLAPDLAVGHAQPIEAWHYCEAAHLLDDQVVRYYAAPLRASELHRRANPILAYATIAGARVVVGPDAAMLHERHVEIRQTTIEPRALGRQSPDDARAAVTRARERRAQNDALNRGRIQHTTLRPQLRRPIPIPRAMK